MGVCQGVGDIEGIEKMVGGMVWLPSGVYNTGMDGGGLYYMPTDWVFAWWRVDFVTVHCSCVSMELKRRDDRNVLERMV